ncbi:MAG: DUF1294 domain-containing protein [Muribaculaceae bacterium]|nr:DUF1294 domain-containing protein [Muribaculaceae bacterium]
MLALIYIFLLLNLISWMLVGYNKHLQIYGRDRSNEVWIMILSIVLGSFGALCGMVQFRNELTRSVGRWIAVLACVQVFLLAIIIYLT